MITDEMLASAAEELVLVMNEVFPDPAKETHHFSLRFKRKMSKLIKKTDHPIRYIWAKRVAGLILALWVGFVVVFAVSPTVRASVIGWIKETYESYIEYFFNDSLSDRAENKEEYNISSLPEGYILSQRVNPDGFCMVVYSNENGDKIDFVYSKDSDAGNMLIKAENAVIVPTYINECEAEMYLPNDPNNATGIIWYDTEKNMMFYLSAVCSKDIIIHMAKSVK